jgi:preprotein translocase subunit SecD
MSKRFRFILILAVIGVSMYFVYPSFQWYFGVTPEEKELAAGSREQVRGIARDRAEAALDAISELAEESPGTPLPQEYAFLRQESQRLYDLAGADRPDEWTVTTVLRGFRDQAEAFEALESHYASEIFELKDAKNRIIELGLDLFGGMSAVVEANEESLAERLGREPTDAELDEAIDNAVTVLTNRIDEFGVTEPQIRRREGTNQILIEVPGDSDRSRIESYLQGKGSLAFHLVDEDALTQLIELQQQQPGWDPEDDGVPEFIPAGTTVAEYVTPDQYGILQHVRYIAIKEDVEENGLDGNYLTNATVGREPLTGQPTVNFEINREGSEIFARLTRENVGTSLAIVQDGKVRAAAGIRHEIPTGQVQISGFNQQEAQNIATVLRTDALQVDLEIINQQAIGASLGAEAVQAGLRSIAVGFGLVIIFMLVYYLGAGVIADLALILNLFFIVSILSVFNLTLTLTSIAGVILTVGMAVDANVIIFERIKEEYHLGKSPKAAVAAGFQKAFWTVMDANITTFIAALFLSQLGTGPVQGFAITLAVGIVSSMFTALFVSRLVFDFSTDVLRRSKLSIGWRTR